MRIALLLALIVAVPDSALPGDRYAGAVRAYFRGSEYCWNVKTPSRRTVEKEIEQLRESSARLWPDQPETALWNLTALMLTEGEGHTKGVKNDPDIERLGPGHISLWEAVTAAKIYNIKAPDVRKPGGKIWFRNKLKGNVKFAVDCYVATIKYYFTQHNSDWDATVCAFKYGPGRYASIVMKSRKKPSQLRAWKGYETKLKVLRCLERDPDMSGKELCDCMKIEEEKNEQK